MTRDRFEGKGGCCARTRRSSKRCRNIPAECQGDFRDHGAGEFAGLGGSARMRRAFPSEGIGVIGLISVLVFQLEALMLPPVRIPPLPARRVVRDGEP